MELSWPAILKKEKVVKTVCVSQVLGIQVLFASLKTVSAQN